MSYFTYATDLIPGSLARSDVVDTNFQSVQVGFEAVEADVFRTIRLTDGAAPAEADFQIATSAAARANKVLGFDATGKPAVVSDVGSWEGAWETATAYLAKSIVIGPDANNNSIYICLSNHTSGTFSTDLSSGKWELMIDLTVVKQSIITHKLIDDGDSPYQLSAGEDVMVDVSGGAVTLTLPVAPAIGDQPINIMHVDGDIGVNAITIARNGKPIMELAENMTVDVPNASFGLAFCNDTLGWRVRGV